MIRIAAALLVLVAQAPTSSAIHGRVVDGTTAEPVSGARFVLALPDGSSPRSTTSDDDGRFAFPNLSSGNYRLAVAAEGYVRQEYQRGRVIPIAAGENRSDLAISLVRTGSVSGHVREIDGRPAVGVPVQLWGIQYDQTGRRTLHLSYTVKTNDRGEYRFFWVTPGSYSVSGGSATAQTPRQRAQSAGINANIFPEPLLAPTYFPNSVEVFPDREVTGIDFALNSVGVFRIRGRIIDQSGGLIAKSPVLVAYAGAEPTSGSGGAALQTFSSRAIAPDGTFEIEDVPAGSYEVGLLLNARVAETVQAWPVHVDIRNADVDGVFLNAVRAMPLRGRLSLEDQPVSSLKSRDELKISLVKMRDATPLVAARTPSDTRQALSADGSFQFAGVIPGDYRIIVSAPDSWEYYVKEIRYGQLNVQHETFRVAADSTASLAVIVRAHPGEISGTVVDEKQQPVTGIQVVLVPDLHRNLTELLRKTNADREGRFTFHAIPPGNYRVFAWEDIEPYSYLNEAVLKQYEAGGQPIRVDEGTSATVTVRAIPASR